MKDNISIGRQGRRAGRLAHRLRFALVPAAGALALATAVALPLATPANASGTLPGSVVPAQDPFYTAPANIASLQPGQIVASRPVTLNLSVPSHAWQISYKSENSLGNPELTVTTLIVPNAAWTGAGSRPAVSYQGPEDSTGTQCAPSYVMAKSKGSGYDLDLGTMLGYGWAVTDPDYEGPNSAWMAGPQAGHAVLDGIRAADSFTTGGLSTSTQWALDGYSGGAQATGWAAQLQPTYAPELHIAGVSMGGTPADPEAVGQYIDGTLFSGFEFAASWGINQDFPIANLTSILNAKGQLAETQVAGKCLPDILLMFPFKKIADYSTVPNPFAVPSIAAVLKEDTLGQAVPTSAPIYDYHGDADKIVPVTQDNTLVSNWCTLGAKVEEVRNAGQGHVSEIAAGESGSLSFLKASFAGQKPTSTC